MVGLAVVAKPAGQSNPGCFKGGVTDLGSKYFCSRIHGFSINYPYNDCQTIPNATMTPAAQIPRELQTMIDSELSSGERVMWSVQPVPGRLARKATPIVLFGIPWTAFAIFWTVGATWGTSKIEGAGLFSAFPLFGLPFILIGLGMLSSPYWVGRKARRTAYVLTNRRAIVLAGGWRGSITVRSFEPERLHDLRRKQYPDGSGDLVFAQDIRRDSDGDRHTTDVGFLAIREVKSVEEMVRGLVAQKRNEIE